MHSFFCKKTLANLEYEPLFGIQMSQKNSIILLKLKKLLCKNVLCPTQGKLCSLKIILLFVCILISKRTFNAYIGCKWDKNEKVIMVSRPSVKFGFWTCKVFVFQQHTYLFLLVCFLVLWSPCCHFCECIENSVLV